MIGSSPYLTFWQVAERWAQELNKPVMDIVQIMRAQATYKYPYPHPCQVPSLLVWPTACFSAQGEISELSMFNANRMAEKEPSSSLEELMPSGSKYRTKYRTPEYIAAEVYFNSADCPPEPTEEIKRHLSHFVIRREDFRKWCLDEGEPLPRFWFHVEEEKKTSCPDALPKKKSNLPDRKGQTIPKEKRRKEEDFTRITASLFEQLQEEGNTEVLEPRQIDAFLNCLKKRINDDVKLKDSMETYSELTEKVKIGDPQQCILMKKPRVVAGQAARKNEWYTRNDLSRRLSELRSIHRAVLS